MMNPTRVVRHFVQDEPLLGRIACEKGYLTPGQLDDCLKSQEVLRPPRARRTIGAYRIRRELGRGGMAVVYEADEPKLRRRIALKVIRERDSEPETIRRMYREAAILAQFDHPNIVRVHTVGAARDTAGESVHYIAMDLVQGRTLGDVLRDGRTPRAELLRLLEEAARGVAHAHARGVVHRDLKPENILVDTRGRVRITDFGLARSGLFPKGLTSSYVIMGTPQYMAPEQVVAERGGVDARADVYALGALLFQILEGATPFESESVHEIFHKILNDPTPPLRKGTDPDLAWICSKAISKDRERRHRTAGEFAGDLALWRRGEPVAPCGWWVRCRSRIRAWWRR